MKRLIWKAARFQVYKAIREEKNDHAFHSRLKIVMQELFHEDPIIFRDL